MHRVPCIFGAISVHLNFLCQLKPMEVSGSIGSNDLINMRQKRVKVSEKILERKLRIWVLGEGGLCWKFTSPNMAGVPDRICLFIKARFAFVEVKTTGNKPTKFQAYVHKILRRLWIPVFVIDDYESFEVFKNWVRSGKRFYTEQYDEAA